MNNMLVLLEHGTLAHTLARMLAMVLLLNTAVAQSGKPHTAAMPEGFDQYVQQVLEAFEVPGVSISVVKEGEILLAKGYGVKVLDKPDPVDDRTLFCIASNSKAFTATLLALLVEEGKIGWDDLVIDHLPWFKMADPYVTNHLTIEDLLVHRSGLGLGAGDLLQFPPTTYSAREIVERLKYIPLATSFRQAYAYDNILYVVAGELIREITGKSWEENVESRIFQPLGMSGSIARISELMKQPNIAHPHTPVEGVVAVGRNFPDIRMGDASNAAGGISSNARDMAAWLKFQLDSGMSPSGKRLLPPAAIERLWTIVTPMPLYKPRPHLAPLKQQYSGYGLGFRIHNYRDHQIVTHTGGLSGAFYSRVTLVPRLGLGIAVLTNQESRNAFEAITHHLMDNFLQVKPEFDWLAAHQQEEDLQKARVATIESVAHQQRDSLSSPSLNLQAYAGTYRDRWYGDVVIEVEGDSLAIRFSQTPALVGRLRHWQHNTFVAWWDDRSLKSDAFVTFIIGPEGKVDEIKMKAFSPAVNFSRDFHDLELFPVKN